VIPLLLSTLNGGGLESAGQQVRAAEAAHLRGRQPLDREHTPWIGVWLTEHLDLDYQARHTIDAIPEEPHASLPAHCQAQVVPQRIT
jgi:hypothetical protein